MDQFQSGKSTAMPQTDLKQSHSSSPQPDFAKQNTTSNLDSQSLQTTSSNPYITQLTPSHALSNDPLYFGLESSTQQGHQSNILDYTFLQASNQQQQAAPNQHQGIQIHNTSSDFNNSDPSFDELDTLNFDNPFEPNQDFGSSFAVDPSLLQSQQSNTHLDNNLELQNGMATIHQRSPEAPHLLQPNVHHLSISGAHPAQFRNEAPFTSSYHSRNASLDPSSAAFTPGMEQNWNNPAFMHRRTPSQQSDASSAAHSPFLLHQDSFDNVGQPSPLMNGNIDPFLVPDMSSFSLTDAQRHPNQHISPLHSPNRSPYLGAQQVPLFTNENCFNQSTMANQNYTIGTNGNLFNTEDAFPSIEGSDYGQMSPPAINIDFAPSTKPSTVFPPQGVGDVDALVVPERTSFSQGRRNRAVSESFATSPKSRGTSPGRSRSPSVGMTSTNHVSQKGSTGSSAGVHKSSLRRSSSPAVPADREYILNLVARQPSESDINGVDPLTDPNTGSPNNSDGGSASGTNRRNQKHPSTFHCKLCSKSFTRAYNLRSHLRTHTDERPFVCTVCGKAFARQHDRKRHESLHSGEKKFVCRGELSENQHWGCGRGFARADALGRHFRSEAGRSCIKPLLDEEARERQLAAMDQANHDMLNGQAGNQPLHNVPTPLDPAQIPLPFALLQMYPALADMWYTMGPTINEDDMSGMEESDIENGSRNSFDASSGGEYYDDDHNGNHNNEGLGMNGMATSYPQAWQ